MILRAVLRGGAFLLVGVIGFAAGVYADQAYPDWIPYIASHQTGRVNTSELQDAIRVIQAEYVDSNLDTTKLSRGTINGLVASLGDRPVSDIATVITLSTGSVRLLITDDGGRIDVGKAPEEVLAGLFRVIGAPQAHAEDVAHAIVAWRNRDNGPARSSEAAKQKSASDQPFTDVRQLALVPGFPLAWLEPIAALTTVVGNDTVNPLTAPTDVIAALPGMEPGRLEAFLGARRAFPTDENRLVAMLGQAQRYAKPAKRRAITVRITAALANGYEGAARAVIVLLPQDQQPYRVLVWTPLAASAVP